MRIKNGLAVGVILLFIGVAVQPGIAIVQPEDNVVEPLESYDYLTVEWKNRFLFMTMIIKNPLNRSVYNINWRLELDDMGDFVFNWHIDYPTELITGNQEILEPNSEIRIRTRVNGFGYIWNYLRVKYDDWTTITLDKVRYTYIIGPFILWFGHTS